MFIITRFLHNIHQIEKSLSFELTPETTFVEVQEDNSRKNGLGDLSWVSGWFLARNRVAFETFHCYFIKPSLHTYQHFSNWCDQWGTTQADNDKLTVRPIKLTIHKLIKEQLGRSNYTNKWVRHYHITTNWCDQQYSETDRQTGETIYLDQLMSEGVSQTSATNWREKQLQKLVWTRLIYELVWDILLPDWIYNSDTRETSRTDLIIHHELVRLEILQ